MHLKNLMIELLEKLMTLDGIGVFIKYPFN